MKQTKIDKVKQHLLTVGSITGKDAWLMYGYYRLSDGILKIRRRNPNLMITTRMHEAAGETFAVYEITQEGAK
jgi:hypothetical protein